ncbi:amino acid auxin permease family [Plasmopara halstedii]|uniref:Amino acid auxin permease family n=1 Tax=Plasmopara halstedii TaxID=4781 RepID=A0A0P1AHU7_PLAHL|nr:amino acid auxin permease family [Plasmopara halstedii]CEG40056.1 amino acid auxin permease family [Plasmopara halstedii]|eukprot:XP_024576425.1 amino acid auxin permease family [Plasmopara halstedii]
MAQTPFLTIEDAKIGFNIFCCFCGIGSLSMPSNYARAGPIHGTIALLLMAFVNIYATIALSKVIYTAPSSVKTFTDVGAWVLGSTGRYAVMISQMLVCLLLPCAFLVLGSILLDVLFPNAFSQIFWMIFMAITVIPVCMIPTLKEAASIALVGCIGTITADVVGVMILEWEMQGHPSIPEPNISFHQVLMAFGNLALSYGAAVVLPDLQRQHPQPERMPRIIFISMTTGTVFFLAIAIAGYAAGGCQLSGNLLFSIVNASDPYATSALGFIPNRGAVIMAYMFMHIHIVIAFSTIIMPAFYMAERFILGMHKDQSVLDEEQGIDMREKPSSLANASNSDSNFAASISPQVAIKYEDESAEYRGKINTIRYILLRLIILTLLVVASIFLRGKFLDLVDFTGASAVTVGSIVLPLLFYLKVFWNKLSMLERTGCILITVVCSILGIYVMIYAAMNLFTPETNTTTFPYCSDAYQADPYYIRDSTSS